jgi:hypothetical protein
MQDESFLAVVNFFTPRRRLGALRQLVWVVQQWFQQGRLCRFRGQEQRVTQGLEPSIRRAH